MTPEFWKATFAAYGWVSCTLAPSTPSLQAHAESQCLSVGIPHSHHGVMRATAVLTSASSLARLAGIANELAASTPSYSDRLPMLVLGTRPFVDCVGGRECTVLGMLVFATPLLLTQTAPMTLAKCEGMWLPYFEDTNDWVMTGWDPAGRVSDVFKPLGWGCPLLGSGAATSRGSNMASRAGSSV